jgi:hypothetical protein
MVIEFNTVSKRTVNEQSVEHHYSFPDIEGDEFLLRSIKITV